MKLTNLIAIAALLGTSVEEVYAIRRHHHHSHIYRPHFVQTEADKVDDIQTKDPKFAELQKKKLALKADLEEATGEKELTEEEEKEKFEKEELPKMELEGKKVAVDNKIK